MGKMTNPAHPGKCLRESVRAVGWTVTEAARHLGLSRVMASRLLSTGAPDGSHGARHRAPRVE